MKKLCRRSIAKLAPIFAAITIAVSLLAISVQVASAKKKEKKTYLPDLVLKAESAVVVILPGGEALDDPFGNQKAKEEVEKALTKWGKYRVALDNITADLVIGVRKGTGKAASPTINGGPVDQHTGTVETTDNSVRIGVQRGKPVESQDDSSGGPVHTGVQAGGQEDVFKVFESGPYIPNPVDRPSLWTYTAKDGLKPPRVAAVEEFRKVVEDSEKAAVQRQQQKQQKAQAKNP